jgi:hypothetical protein
LRRLFPGISDNVKAREFARTIAGWTLQPAAGVKFIEQKGGGPDVHLKAKAAT